MSVKKSIVRAASAILPESIKNSLFHLSFNLAPQEFARFAHLYAFAPNMELGLRRMAGLGFNVATIIDVGAYRGDWSRMARSVWPGAAIAMFEPNADREPSCASTAKELGALLHQKLLGAEAGKEVVFNVMASGSSVFSERSPLEREAVTKRLSTLDDELPNLTGPVLLKIDAQGYELEILKGAKKTIGSVTAVVLEVAIMEINRGAPLLDEVLAFMKAEGFVTYDILEVHRRPLDGALNQVDIVFVREDSPLIADKQHFASRQDERLSVTA